MLLKMYHCPATLVPCRASCHICVLRCIKHFASTKAGLELGVPEEFKMLQGKMFYF